MQRSGRPAEREDFRGARHEGLTPRAIAIVVAVWLVSLLLWIQPGVVRPDGGGYLVYLVSPWLDRDLLFFDEWQELRMVRDGIIQHKEITPRDHLGNHWTAGSAIFWFPSFAIADQIRGYPRNGFSLPYNLGVIFTTAVAGLVTLLAGMRAARTTPFAATVAAIGAWLGTPLLWYSVIHATMAHAMSALTCGVLFLVRRGERVPRAEQLLAGLAAGLAFAVRPQNAPFAAVPPLLDRRYVSLPYAAGLALGALPQLVASYFIYGSPLGFLGRGGGSFALYQPAFQRIYIREALLSWYHGLVPWSPFAAIGIVGLVLLFRRDRRLAIAALLMIAAQALINGTLDRAFWSGMSFGQRRFDNCTVLFLIGAAVLVERVGRVAGAALVAAASAWTMSLFFAARRGLDLERYLAPSELFAAPRDLAMQFVPLGAIPAALRPQVLALLAVFAVAAIVGVILVRTMSTKTAATVATAYLVAASLFLAWCGRNDAAHLVRYRALIDRNRPFGGFPGGVDYRVTMLRYEAEYLRKSGRIEEAADVETEIARRSPR